MTTFGTSGFTYANTFVLYDRETESLWYPTGDGFITAVAGPRVNQKIQYDSEEPVTTLGEWRAEYPDTVVLLGSAAGLERFAEDEEAEELQGDSTD
jgi:uncharacterized protein DUF3179